jgi:formylglycine-generating enzyme required for sulfatase activity
MPVPRGTFNRRNDVLLPATVSAFELDVFEVTVGRFRAFIESGGATQAHAPTAGTGAHPKLPGSGWHDEWDLRLPQDIGQLTSSLNGGKSTWTDAPGANEHLPINNVQWLQAFAFCAWDGGRLPTYAELSFAATGGDEQRMYPWGNTAPSGNPAIQAAFNCNFKLPVRSCSTAGCFGCELPDIAPVGSLPAGAGKFGQLDLAGNVAEFTLDLADPPDEARPPPVCDDCAVVLTTDPDKAIIGNKQFTAQFFSIGGAWDGSGSELQTSSYGRRKYDERQDSQGFRCAREARVLP